MPLVLKQKIFSPKQLQQHNFNLGKKGENHAKKYFQKRGFLLLAENYLSSWGSEIDLIILDPSENPEKPVLVFVEVKTRSKEIFGDPAQAVNRHKLSQISRAAQEFRRLNRTLVCQLDFRFDILAITPRQTIHFPNVSWLAR